MNRTSKAVLFMSLAAVLIIGVSSQLHVYRFCGHRQSLYDKYFPHLAYATHCCVAGGLVTDLTTLYFAEQAYHIDTGQYAPDLAVLEGRYMESRHAVPEDYTLVLSGTTSHWQCAVSRTPRLPGYYLIRSDGTIYFSEDHAATTEDVVLSRRGR